MNFESCKASLKKKNILEKLSQRPVHLSNLRLNSIKNLFLNILEERRPKIFLISAHKLTPSFLKIHKSSSPGLQNPLILTGPIVKYNGATLDTYVFGSLQLSYFMAVML